MKIEFKDYRTGETAMSIPVVATADNIATERVLEPLKGITDFWIECALYCINCGMVSGTIDDEHDNPLMTWQFVK